MKIKHYFQNKANDNLDFALKTQGESILRVENQYKPALKTQKHLNVSFQTRVKSDFPVNQPTDEDPSQISSWPGSCTARNVKTRGRN